MQKSPLIACLAALGLGLTVVSGAALAMSARPSTGVQPASDAQPARDRFACFSSNDVSSFQSINDHKMVVISNRNEAYELTLGGVCIGADTSFRIGIKSRGSGMADICGPFDGEIIYSDLGRGLQSCPITRVQHLTGEAAAPYIGKRKSEQAK